MEALVVPSEAGFLNALVEEYEGLAVMRTIDRKEGRLKFWVPDSQLELARAVFDDFVERGWMLEYKAIDPWWEPMEDRES